MDNIAIEMWSGTSEIASVSRASEEPGIYSGVNGTSFVAPTLARAKALAIDYANDERATWADFIANVRAVRTKDVSP